MSPGPSVQVFAWTYVCLSLTQEKSVPRSGSADSSGDSAIKVFATFYSPTSNVRGFRFLHTLATLQIVCLFNLFILLTLFTYFVFFIRTIWWVWIASHDAFSFPDDERGWASFCALRVLGGQRSLQVHCPFLKLSCLSYIKSFIYSGFKSLIPLPWFASIFSHSADCLSLSWWRPLQLQSF